MDGLKSHDLWFCGISFLQDLTKMGHIIVAENEFLSAAVPDTLNHWGVVTRVRVDFTT